MADSFIQEQEELELFRQKQGSGSSFAEPTFRATKSAGNNPVKLAQILAVYDYACRLLGWPNDLSEIVANYQASVNSEYHKDYVKIATLHHAIDMLRRSRAATAFQPSMSDRAETQQQ